jgi:ferredoxin-NADP reductase
MVRNGKVSSRLEAGIERGHKVGVEGPFGSAYLRRGEGARLILVASGTGFAPIWAIAKASLQTQPTMPLLLIAGSRRINSLYMSPALCRLAVYPTADFIATTEEPQSISEIVRVGSPARYVPELRPSDLVYAAGSPSVVQAVGDMAATAGSAFYADPFVASGGPEPSWFARQMAKVRVEDLKLRLRALISSADGTAETMKGADHCLQGGAVAYHGQTPILDEDIQCNRFWRNVV